MFNNTFFYRHDVFKIADMYFLFFQIAVRITHEEPDITFSKYYKKNVMLINSLKITLIFKTEKSTCLKYIENDNLINCGIFLVPKVYTS